MSHVIIRGDNGRRHEVDFGEAEITVSLHTSTETVELASRADDPDHMPSPNPSTEGKKLRLSPSPPRVHFTQSWALT